MVVKLTGLKLVAPIKAAAVAPGPVRLRFLFIQSSRPTVCSTKVKSEEYGHH